MRSVQRIGTAFPDCPTPSTPHRIGRPVGQTTTSTALVGPPEFVGFPMERAGLSLVSETTAMSELARGYAAEGLSAYVRLQEREFAAEEAGYTTRRHQREVGAGLLRPGRPRPSPAARA